jgi:hypothetical protein
MIRDMGSRNGTIVGMNVRSMIIIRASTATINRLTKSLTTGVPTRIREINAVAAITTASTSIWVEAGRTIA